MKKTILFAALLSCVLASAQQLNVGLRFQKTHSMYWENGISAQYSFANFKPDRFYVGFDFVTSSLGTAMGSNALKQSSYIFSGSWYFNHGKQFRLIGRLNVGYLFANLEDEIFDELPSTAFLLAPEFGMSYQFKDLPIRINAGLGYYLGVQEAYNTPGTFQPLYYHFTLYYNLLKP
jgi:hypothetical protein